MLFLTYLFNFILGDSDFYGVVYEDKEKTILKKAPSDIIKYEIPASAKIIRGGKSDYGPFYESIANLKNLTFARNSNLIEIEPFGLAYLKVETIDLSPCVKLEELGYSSFRYCEAKTIILPPFLKRIRSGALHKMVNIKSISFPDTLEYLESYHKQHSSVMGECYNLQSIDWGNDPIIKEIGTDCFRNTLITSFKIPKMLQKIGDASLIGCPIEKFEIDPKNDYFSSDKGVLFDKNKTKILFCSKTMEGNYTVPDTVTALSGSSFRATTLKSIILSKSVQRLGYLAMYGSKIEYISVPSTVTFVDGGCFMDCSNLKTIDFNPNIASLYESVFSGCTSLEEIRLPVSFDSQAIPTIGPRAFSGCKQLGSVVLEENTKEIQQWAFEGCTGLSRFEISKTVQKIGQGALENCINLEEISVARESVLSTIDPLAFTGCSRLERFIIPADNENFKSFDGLVTDFERTNILLHLPGYNSTNCAIPTSVKVVSDYAFKGAFYLESVSFEGCKDVDIKYRAFYGCPILSKIVLGDSIKSIAGDSFGDCPNIKCGSIAHVKELRPILERSGLSPNIYLPCPTEVFTMGNSLLPSFGFSSSLLSIGCEDNLGI